MTLKRSHGTFVAQRVRWSPSKEATMANPLRSLHSFFGFSTPALLLIVAACGAQQMPPEPPRHLPAPIEAPPSKCMGTPTACTDLSVDLCMQQDGCKLVRCTGTPSCPAKLSVTECENRPLCFVDWASRGECRNIYSACDWLDANRCSRQPGCTEGWSCVGAPPSSCSIGSAVTCGPLLGCSADCAQGCADIGEDGSG